MACPPLYLVIAIFTVLIKDRVLMTLLPRADLSFFF
jgi:hypothetical protein